MTRTSRPKRMPVEDDANALGLDLEPMVITNPLCPHRSRCLDDACIKNVPHLDCSDCMHMFEYEDKGILFSDVEGCLRLLWTLCGNANRFDRHEAERQLFDRRDWQEDPIMPNNYLSV